MYVVDRCYCSKECIEKDIPFFVENSEKYVDECLKLDMERVDDYGNKLPSVLEDDPEDDSNDTPGKRKRKSRGKKKQRDPNRRSKPNTPFLRSRPMPPASMTDYNNADNTEKKEMVNKFRLLVLKDCQELIPQVNYHQHNATCWKKSKIHCRFLYDKNRPPKKALIIDSVVDLRGPEAKILSKRWHSNLSEFHPILSTCVRSNTNVVFLTSHVIGKKVCAYVCYYAAKMDCKPKDFVLLASKARKEIFEEHPENTPREKARRMLNRALLRLNNFTKITLMEACSSLMGYPIWYTSHETVNFHWPSVVNHVNREIDDVDEPDMYTDGNEKFSHFCPRVDPVTKKTTVLPDIISDYKGRSKNLENWSLYRFLRMLVRCKMTEQEQKYLILTQLRRCFKPQLDELEVPVKKKSKTKEDQQESKASSKNIFEKLMNVFISTKDDFNDHAALFSKISEISKSSTLPEQATTSNVSKLDIVCDAEIFLDRNSECDSDSNSNEPQNAFDIPISGLPSSVEINTHKQRKSGHDSHESDEASTSGDKDFERYECDGSILIRSTNSQNRQCTPCEDPNMNIFHAKLSTKFKWLFFNSDK